MLRTARQANPPRQPRREAIVNMVSAAVVEMHQQALQDRPDWFWHLLKRCEVKAAKIAEQAAQGQYACGDATFCEVYAKTLPMLFTQALERLDSPEAD
jgi:hypothetical protein